MVVHHDQPQVSSRGATPKPMVSPNELNMLLTNHQRVNRWAGNQEPSQKKDQHRSTINHPHESLPISHQLSTMNKEH